MNFHRLMFELVNKDFWNKDFWNKEQGFLNRANRFHHLVFALCSKNLYSKEYDINSDWNNHKQISEINL